MGINIQNKKKTAYFCTVSNLETQTRKKKQNLSRYTARRRLEGEEV
jgi:hypothetical protein